MSEVDENPIHIGGNLSELLPILHRILDRFGDMPVGITVGPDDHGDELLQVTGVGVAEYQNGSHSVELYDWDFNMRQSEL